MLPWVVIRILATVLKVEKIRDPECECTKLNIQFCVQIEDEIEKMKI
jgi:hypothetical protein